MLLHVMEPTLPVNPAFHPIPNRKPGRLGAHVHYPSLFVNHIHHNGGTKTPHVVQLTTRRG